MEIHRQIHLSSQKHLKTQIETNKTKKMKPFKIQKKHFKTEITFH